MSSCVLPNDLLNHCIKNYLTQQDQANLWIAFHGTEIIKSKQEKSRQSSQECFQKRLKERIAMIDVFLTENFDLIHAHLSKGGALYLGFVSNLLIFNHKYTYNDLIDIFGFEYNRSLINPYLKKHWGLYIDHHSSLKYHNSIEDC